MKNKLIWMLLSLLGFSTACDKLGLQSDAYGTPHAYFSVKGKVVNSEGEPIQNVEVNPEDGPIVLTDQFGEFVFDKSMAFSLPDDKLTFAFRDVDGEQGGLFNDKSLEVEFRQVKAGSGSWYSGTYEADDQNVVMQQVTEYGGYKVYGYLIDRYASGSRPTKSLEVRTTIDDQVTYTDVYGYFEITAQTKLSERVQKLIVKDVSDEPHYKDKEFSISFKLIDDAYVCDVGRVNVPLLEEK